MTPAEVRSRLPFLPPTRATSAWSPWALLLPLIIVALAAAAMPSPELTSAWELNRSALAGGQWWRLFTGHLTHWNFDHLLWDAAAFLALGLLCMQRSATRTIACLIASSVAISVTVLVAHGDLSSYRGLSGLDTALFTLAATLTWRDARRDSDRAMAAVAKWALGALVAKTLYELATGDTLFVDSAQAGFVPLASAHAVGAAVGFLAALLTGPRLCERALPAPQERQKLLQILAALFATMRLRRPRRARTQACDGRSLIT
jgi:rhomboid family GlyGly-CTERM serine protease